MGRTKVIPNGTNKDADRLSERFQASFHYKTPPVVRSHQPGRRLKVDLIT
jgi:hypothetical protein